LEKDSATEMPVPVFTVNGGPVNYYAVTLTSLRCHLPSIYIFSYLKMIMQIIEKLREDR
jgi:hypothetical protein